MDKKSIHQNESIQDGLERFLDDQLLGGKVEKRQLDVIANEIPPLYEEPRAPKKQNLSFEPQRRGTVQAKEEKKQYKAAYVPKEDLYEEYEEEYGYDDGDEDGYEEYEDAASYRVRQKNSPSRRQAEKRRSAEYNEDIRPQRERRAPKSSKKAEKKLSKKQAKKQAKKNGAKEKKKTSKFKKILIVLLLVAAALLIWWYFMVGSAYQKMNHEKETSTLTGPMKEDGVINVLLIGNDSRLNGEDGRSDAMILVSISKKTKTIHMTSFLRDMYVEIPGHDNNRLNAAYSYGGADLLCETIEKNFDLDVNRYAIVNFQAFASLVDAVGGVDLEVTNEEVQWINAYLNEYNLLEGRDITTDYLDTSLSGNIHLNGPQALAYSRNRYIGTDFGRTERQRKVLDAVVKKMPVALATNSNKLIDELFPNLTTNLSKLECYQFSLDASKLLSYDMIQSVVPIEGSYKNATIRKMAVLEVDFDANKSYLKKEIYGEE